MECLYNSLIGNKNNVYNYYKFVIEIDIFIVKFKMILRLSVFSLVLLLLFVGLGFMCIFLFKKLNCLLFFRL